MTCVYPYLGKLMISGTVIKFYTVGKVCQQGTEGVLTFYYNDISVKLIINLGNINLIEIILLKEKSVWFLFSWQFSGSQKLKDMNTRISEKIIASIIIIENY